MLALISGRGGLPARIAEQQQTPPLICVLDGFPPDRLKPDIVFRLEHLGSLIGTLKKRGVTELCLCGAITRPAFDPTALDVETVPLVPQLQQALSAGDDSALRAIMALFEAEGFTIRAAHELAPDILIRAGVLSKTVPSDSMKADALRGQHILNTLSALDIGQACVVGAGQVWGVETLGGTAHMLQTLPENTRQAQAVLVKAPKSGQDRRADMPTIGPDTIRDAIKAGLAGVVVQAGAVILLEPEETLQLADDAGLVLWSFRAD